MSYKVDINIKDNREVSLPSKVETGDILYYETEGTPCLVVSTPLNWLLVDMIGAEILSSTPRVDGVDTVSVDDLTDGYQHKFAAIKTIEYIIT